MKLPDEARDIIKILEKFPRPLQMAMLTTLLMLVFHYEDMPTERVRMLLNRATDEYGRTIREGK